MRKFRGAPWRHGPPPARTAPPPRRQAPCDRPLPGEIGVRPGLQRLTGEVLARAAQNGHALDDALLVAIGADDAAQRALAARHEGRQTLGRDAADAHAVFQRLHLAKFQRRGQRVVHAGTGVVIVGVHGDHGESVAHQDAQHAALGVVLPQVLPPAKEDRMMGDDQLCAARHSLVDHVHRQIQRAQHRLDGTVGMAGQQARVIPLLLKRQRRDVVQ